MTEAIQEDHKYMTVAQAAEYLQLKPANIYEKAAAGNLPSYKVGKFRRFKRAELDQWVRDQQEVEL